GEPITGTLLALSSDGKRLAVAAADDRVQVYDAASRKLVVPAIEVGPSQRSRAMVTAAAFAPGGSALAVAVDQEIALYDLTSGKPMGDRLIGHRELIDAIVFTSGAERLASLASDDAVILWNAPTRRSLSRVFVDSPDGWGVAFSPRDGSLA